jgi:Protein of unknown function (DUF3572)
VKTTSTSGANSSVIALNLIGFIVSSEDRLERFLSLTGFVEGDLRQRAAEPEFHAFVLEYAMQDEALILSFAENQNISPEVLVSAHQALLGHSDDFT